MNRLKCSNTATDRDARTSRLSLDFLDTALYAAGMIAVTDRAIEIVFFQNGLARPSTRFASRALERLMPPTMRATFNVADYFAGDVEESALSDGHLENTIVSGSLNGGVEPEFFSDLFIAPEPASGILLLFAFALLLAVKPLRARIISGCR